VGAETRHRGPYRPDQAADRGHHFRLRQGEAAGAACQARRLGLKLSNDDQKVGINIVRRALQAPARQIAENAGEDGAVVAGKILDSSDYSFGYNAQTGEYGDLVKQRVIDPAKVVRTALQDAASVAGLLVTTEGYGRREAEAESPVSDATRWRHG
jgi:chaperonin GroEL (HSP60 family)